MQVQVQVQVRVQSQTLRQIQTLPQILFATGSSVAFDIPGRV
ncbi:hypothetical protein [Raineyella sp.]|nr:hypothetical protein [Raineyella sp.]MEA5154884.1 hypothetical protein [Raineyella sp.]